MIYAQPAIIEYHKETIYISDNQNEAHLYAAVHNMIVVKEQGENKYYVVPDRKEAVQIIFTTSE